MWEQPPPESGGQTGKAGDGAQSNEWASDGLWFPVDQRGGAFEVARVRTVLLPRTKRRGIVADALLSNERVRAVADR